MREEEIEHRGDQQRPDPERCGLCRPVQPTHRVGQLCQRVRTDEQEEGADQDQRGNRGFAEPLQHRFAHSMMLPRSRNLQNETVLINPTIANNSAASK